jgi:hypothetical protein
MSHTRRNGTYGILFGFLFFMALCGAIEGVSDALLNQSLAGVVHHLIDGLTGVATFIAGWQSHKLWCAGTEAKKAALQSRDELYRWGGL